MLDRRFGFSQTYKLKTRYAPSLNLILIAALVIIAYPKHATAGKSAQTVEAELKLQAGDETGNDIKAVKTELLVMKSEKRALDELLRLQKKYQNTRMEPEILFRLPEMYMRRARTERFFEMHRDAKDVLSFSPSLVKQASESAEIKKAITIYQKMQTKFPNFRSIDIVVFNNAYAFQQVGDDTSAKAHYQKLIKEHSDSPLVADSYLAIGEIEYARREFKAALENFNAIRAFPLARAFPYGLYKAAWCYYNLQDATSGMKQLEEVIKVGHVMAKSGLGGSKLDLRKEALGDLALFYGDVKPASVAVSYFQTQSREIDAVPYILRLVELYKRHSRYPDVQVVLKDILAKLPDSDSVFQVHEELVWNFERMRERTEAVNELKSFDAYCAQRSDKKEKSSDAASSSPRSACQFKIADVAKKLATKWHAQWKKQGGDDALAINAESGYRVFLKDAQTIDTDLPQLHYSFAELQFARGQFRDAGESYAAINTYKTRNSQPLKVDVKLAHDASYAAIVSLEKAVDAAKWTDADEATFKSRADVYSKGFPAGVYVLDVKFKQAFIAYEKERYDDAAPQFKRIGWTDKYPLPAAAAKVLKAQDLYLDILNIKKDYTALKEAAKSLLHRPDETTLSGSRTMQIEKIYREAYFAEIQSLEEKGEIAKAVESYKRFALENPSSVLAPKAWWNASQLQFKIGDAEGGANTCYQMHKLFPNSPNAKDCLTKAAQTFESMARLDLAARVLLNLADVESAKSGKWRELAADFFALSNQKPRAIAMYFKLSEEESAADGASRATADKYSDVAMSSRLKLLEKASLLAKEIGDKKSVEAIEKKFVQSDTEPQASTLVVAQAEALFVRGELTEAFQLSKKIVARSSLPKALQARARIVQARVLEDEYRKASIKARAERIGIVLAIKTEKLEKAQKAYQSAIGYGDPEQSVRALRLLANCYLDYAHSVRGMSLPASVAASDQATFKNEIEQLSIPMEEKGIEAMGQALETAKKAQVRNGQVAEISRELDKLNMRPSPPVEFAPLVPGIYVPVFARVPAAVAPAIRQDANAPAASPRTKVER